MKTARGTGLFEAFSVPFQLIVQTKPLLHSERAHIKFPHSSARQPVSMRLAALHGFHALMCLMFAICTGLGDYA